VSLTIKMTKVARTPASKARFNREQTSLSVFWSSGSS
jgi:hypothetical protein